jgi:hypothetical protein
MQEHGLTPLCSSAGTLAGDLTPDLWAPLCQHGVLKSFAHFLENLLAMECNMQGKKKVITFRNEARGFGQLKTGVIA